MITVSSNPGILTIDSELMDVYSGTTNCNSMVSFSDDEFPLLGPGENGVDLDSGITAVEITPRWFIL